MSTNLSTYRDLIYQGTGHDSDDEALVDAAVNWAVRAVAASREIPNLSKEGTIDVTVDTEKYAMSFSNLFDVKQAWYRVSSTAERQKMWFIPYDLVSAVLPDLGNFTRPFFYSRHRDDFWAWPALDSVLGTEQFVVDYKKHPDLLTQPSDQVEYDYHDALIVPTALAIFWAFFEEIEDVDMWGSLTAGLQQALGSEQIFLLAGEGIRRFERRAEEESQ